MFIALHQCLPLLVFRPQCQHAEMRVKERSTVLFVRDFFFHCISLFFERNQGRLVHSLSCTGPLPCTNLQ